MVQCLCAARTRVLDEVSLHWQKKARETVKNEASLTGKPQNSGLLVNIEYLVSYPIG